MDAMTDGLARRDTVRLGQPMTEVRAEKICGVARTGRLGQVDQISDELKPCCGNAVFKGSPSSSWCTAGAITIQDTVQPVSGPPQAQEMNTLLCSSGAAARERGARATRP